jgi:hypothetical protein
MKRQKETIGSILEIDLKNGNYAYAQILENGTAFFDYLTNEPLKNFDVLETCPVLFIIGIYKDIITRGYWLKVGKLPIRKELEILPMKFMQDFETYELSLYNPNTGKIYPATREECIGLERASVWEAHHVESRIIDYYNNTPNIWVEQLKIKKE